MRDQEIAETGTGLQPLLFMIRNTVLGVLACAAGNITVVSVDVIGDAFEDAPSHVVVLDEQTLFPRAQAVLLEARFACQSELWRGVRIASAKI